MLFLFVAKQDTCIVCLKEYVLGEEVMEVHCDHFYHTKCLVKWLKKVIF